MALYKEHAFELEYEGESYKVIAQYKIWSSSFSHAFGEESETESDCESWALFLGQTEIKPETISDAFGYVIDQACDKELDSKINEWASELEDDDSSGQEDDYREDR